MKPKPIAENQSFRSLGGALLAVLCGLLLWWAPFGETWVNASYDYLFRFGTHAVTNKVTLILMDNDAFDHFHQTREQPWDRGLHAQLLNRLADDGCALVVIDSFFRGPRDPVKDQALADALQRQRHVVLMAEQAQVTHPSVTGAQPTLPGEPFLSAARTNWGVAWLDPDLDWIVRRHWPFPMPGPYPSVPGVAAQSVGVRLSPEPRELWLRYYGHDGPWTKLSYRFALNQPAGYFRDRIVFIGTQPKTSLPDNEPDEFRTPYTRWTGESTGGVEIILTSFLNLLNNDGLRRPPGWMEASLLIAAGAILGGGLCRLRPLPAGILATAIAATVAVGSICGSYYTNYWFPWLVIAGGQIPCSLAWAMLTAATFRKTVPDIAVPPAAPAEKPPVIPGYEVFHPPFGEGAYGRVWLAKNKAGQWRALKVIYLAKFGEDTGPYDREFDGISRYQPLSDRHPGMLRVDFVSDKRPDYFYYVMELGDALEPGWESNPSAYKPCNLFTSRARTQKPRLTVKECVRIGLALTDALEFLHNQGLTHRDIKPQNIIYVNGQPKLADLGLMAKIRPVGEAATYVGTPGYMPPPPEPPGTPQADIYALGMVLYVMSTGRGAAFFPDVATSLVQETALAGYFPLNSIVLKACQPDPTQRYASAAAMHQALQELKQKLQAGESSG